MICGSTDDARHSLICQGGLRRAALDEAYDPTFLRLKTHREDHSFLSFKPSLE
jgi:hypothetical protein